MLTDIALHVGQTLTAAVNLPPRQPLKPSSKRPLAMVRGWADFVARTLHTSRQVRHLERDLHQLPDGVVNDLDVNKSRFRDRSLLESWLTGRRGLRLVNGWFN